MMMRDGVACVVPLFVWTSIYASEAKIKDERLQFLAARICC